MLPKLGRACIGSSPGFQEHNQITGYMSLYKMGPKVYRAGVALAAPPVKLPEGLDHVEFSGGKFNRFVLTGPYANLGQATGRVMQIISETKLPVRDDYFIENYVNDPERRLKSSSSPKSWCLRSRGCGKVAFGWVRALEAA